MIIGCFVKKYFYFCDFDFSNGKVFVFDIGLVLGILVFVFKKNVF